MEAMTPTEQDIERLKALVKKADLREGKWQPGTAGNADLVAYNGEDITGIATVNDPNRVKFIAALRNAVDSGLLDFALRGVRSETTAPNASVSAEITLGQQIIARAITHDPDAARRADAERRGKEHG